MKPKTTSKMSEMNTFGSEPVLGEDCDETTKGIEWILDYDGNFCERSVYRNVMTYLAGAPEREAQRERELRRRKVKNHMESFISNSTVHGLHYCFDKRHSVRRLVWTLLILTALGLLVEKLYESTVHFFSYPFSTTTTIKYKDTMKFPAVSFCNLNDLRMSAVNGTKLHKAILNQENLVLSLTGEEYKNTTKNANHRLQDMLYDCQFVRSGCGGRNFTEFFHNQGDRCFTFNSGKESHPLLKVENTGVGHSLQLVINIEHYDYYMDTDKSGIHLILHGQNETPVKMQGVIVSPGFITYVDVRRRKLKNLPYPYKTNCGSKPLKFFSGYSMHLCWLESLTNYVVDKCSCRDWFMPGDNKVCSLNESMSCMWPKWAEFDKYKMYDCPLPCEIETYSTRLSFAQFPSNAIADAMAKDLKLNGSPLENRFFIRDNFLKVVIYYSELSYDYMEQVPSYDLMVLLGDIGGQLGLFLGSSILTYLEFFDCLIMLIYSRFFEKIRPTSAPV